MGYWQLFLVGEGIVADFRGPLHRAHAQILVLFPVGGGLTALPCFNVNPIPETIRQKGTT